MSTDNFCFYLENRLIQSSKTGGQQYSEYSDTSPFSIPWPKSSIQARQRFRDFFDEISELSKFFNDSH
jgi:hypothetical protein